MVTQHYAILANEVYGYTGIFSRPQVTKNQIDSVNDNSRHAIAWINDDHVQYVNVHIDGLVQNCSNSIALAMEILLFCTQPLIYYP